MPQIPDDAHEPPAARRRGRRGKPDKVVKTAAHARVRRARERQRERELPSHDEQGRPAVRRGRPPA